MVSDVKTQIPNALRSSHLSYDAGATRAHTARLDTHTACSTVSPLSASPVDDADADGETDCAIVRRAASVPEHTTLTCTAAPGAHTRTYRPSRPAGSRVMRAAAAAESPRPASLTRAGWPHAAPCTNLIQGGLLHDTQKLLLVDLAVAVAVGCAGQAGQQT